MSINPSPLIFSIPTLSPEKDGERLDKESVEIVGRSIMNASEQHFVAQYQKMLGENQDKVPSPSEWNRLQQEATRANRNAQMWYKGLAVMGLSSFVAAFFSAISGILAGSFGALGFVLVVTALAFPLLVILSNKAEKKARATNGLLNNFAPSSKKEKEAFFFNVLALVKHEQISDPFKQFLKEEFQHIVLEDKPSSFVKDLEKMLKSLEENYKMEQAKEDLIQA